MTVPLNNISHTNGRSRKKNRSKIMQNKVVNACNIRYIRADTEVYNYIHRCNNFLLFFVCSSYVTNNTKFSISSWSKCSQCTPKRIHFLYYSLYPCTVFFILNIKHCIQFLFTICLQLNYLLLYISSTLFVIFSVISNGIS